MSTNTLIDCRRLRSSGPEWRHASCTMRQIPTERVTCGASLARPCTCSQPYYGTFPYLSPHPNSELQRTNSDHPIDGYQFAFSVKIIQEPTILPVMFPCLLCRSNFFRGALERNFRKLGIDSNNIFVAVCIILLPQMVSFVRRQHLPTHHHCHDCRLLILQSGRYRRVELATVFSRKAFQRKTENSLLNADQSSAQGVKSRYTFNKGKKFKASCIQNRGGIARFKRLRRARQQMNIFILSARHKRKRVD